MSFNPCVKCNTIPSLGLSRNHAMVCACGIRYIHSENIERDWNAANPLPVNFQQACRDSGYLVRIEELKDRLANKTAKCERQAQELARMNAKIKEHCAGCRHKCAAADMLARDDKINTLRKEIKERDEMIAELINGNKHLLGITQRISKNDAATYQCMADVRRAVREWDRCVAATERA